MLSYEVNKLYSYNKGDDKIDRYLLSFVTEDESTVKNVEFDADPNDILNIVYEESDPITDEDVKLVYYIIDHWAINHLFI